MRKIIADCNRTLPIRSFVRQQPIVVAVAILCVFPWVLILGWGAIYMAAVFYPLSVVAACLANVWRIRRIQGKHGL